MALTTTSLAAAMTAADTNFYATSATGATVGGIAIVEQEIMIVAAITSTLITVERRGSFGTIAKAHNILAPCTFGLVTDLPAAPAGISPTAPKRQVVSYGLAGAIAVPTVDTAVVLTGGSARAMTLANPGAVNDGVLVTIINLSAQAHTVTFGTGLYGSSSDDVATFPSTAGSSFTVLAYNGKWAYVGQSLLIDESAGNVGLA